jgi:hypothetical protein
MTNSKISVPQLLLPVFLISFVMALFLGFQTTLLVSDRVSFQQTHAQQDKPLEQLAKVKAQVNSLAVGTLQLSKQGNKDAITIINELKKAGVDVSDSPAGAPGSPTSPPPAP